MFGTNEIVGQRYFNEITPENRRKLLVTSVFFTLQGEGPHSGKPAVFVRLAKCQLQCNFCDTYFDTGDWYTVDELVNEISKILGRWNKHLDRSVGLVITGGEPALQSDMLAYFLRSTFPYFAWRQVESNGIITFGLAGTETDIVISPKCAEKSGFPSHYIKPSRLNLVVAKCLKFVVTSDIDSPYSRIPDWALEWKDYYRKPIYISPMNIYLKEPQKALIAKKTNTDNDIETRSEEMERISFWESGLLDMKANQRNHEYAAKLCMEYDCILSLQTHLYASLP